MQLPWSLSIYSRDFCHQVQQNKQTIHWQQDLSQLITAKERSDSGVLSSFQKAEWFRIHNLISLIRLLVVIFAGSLTSIQVGFFFLKISPTFFSFNFQKMKRITNMGLRDLKERGIKISKLNYFAQPTNFPDIYIYTYIYKPVGLWLLVTKYLFTGTFLE